MAIYHNFMNDEPISSRESKTMRVVERSVSPRAQKKLEALDKLQASVKARGIDVEAWAREARAERRASSIKRMSVFDDQS